jgi:hypothetical protein
VSSTLESSSGGSNQLNKHASGINIPFGLAHSQVVSGIDGQIYESNDEGLFLTKENSDVILPSIDHLRQDVNNETPKSRLATVTVKNHTNEDGHVPTHLERDILTEIEERPISLIGEATLITNCPHD